MQKLLLVVVAVVILAGCAALLLWRADDGASALTPTATAEKPTPTVAMPEQAPLLQAELESRAPLDVAPSSEDENEPAEVAPAPEGVVLRGRLIGSDGVVLTEQTFQLYVDPFDLPNTTPSVSAETWRRRGSIRFPDPIGLRPDGILNPPYPIGHRLRLTTDEVGRFEAQLPAEAREFGVRLHFEVGDWRSGAKADRELADLSTADPNGEALGDIRLQGVEGQVIVAGVVQSPDGHPVPGAEVRIMGARRFEHEGEMRIGTGDLLRVTCDDHGSFEAQGLLIEGEATEGLRLYGSAEGFAGGQSGAVHVGARDAVIVLGRAARLHGRVEAGLGEPIPSGLEAVLFWQPTAGVDPLTSNRSGTRASVQQDGSFRFDSLKSLRYALRFELRKRPLPHPELQFLDLECLEGQTLLDPRLQPIDLSAHLALYRLWIESAENRDLDSVHVASGKLPEPALATSMFVGLMPVGTFEARAVWLDLAPPLRIELTESSHAPKIVDVYERQDELTVRLTPPAVLEVRLVGGLPPIRAGAELQVRHFPLGRAVPFESDGTASLPIDARTLQFLHVGRGFELELTLLGGPPAHEFQRLEPRFGPTQLGPVEGTLEWTIELPPELLPILAGER